MVPNRLHVVPWPHEARNLDSISIGQAVFAGFTHGPRHSSMLECRGPPYTLVANIHTNRQTDRHTNVRRILVRGVNAPLPPEAKKILKI